MFIRGKNLMYVQAEGDFSGATAFKLTPDGVTLKTEESKIVVETSESENPIDEIVLGNKIDLEATLVDANIQALKDQINDQSTGTEDFKIEASLETPVAKSKHDMKFDVTHINGAVVTGKEVILTNMIFSGGLEMAVKRGEMWYLPLKAIATADSVVTMDDKMVEEE